MLIPWPLATSLVGLSQQGPKAQTCVGAQGLLSCHHSPGELLVLRVTECWLDAISTSLHLWKTSAMLPAHLQLLPSPFEFPLPAQGWLPGSPLCPGGSGLPPQPSPQVCKATGLCLSKHRHCQTDPSVWISSQWLLLQQPRWDQAGGIKRQKWPKPERTGACHGFLFTGRRVARVCAGGSVCLGTLACCGGNSYRLEFGLLSGIMCLAVAVVGTGKRMGRVVPGCGRGELGTRGGQGEMGL